MVVASSRRRGRVIAACLVALIASIASGCGSGGSSTAQPSPAPTVSATVSPTPTASASHAVTSQARGLGSAVLQDLTWVSTREGWALTSVSCGKEHCARIAHTTDGGTHWTALPDPGVVMDGDTDCTHRTCVSDIAFANSKVGFLYAPSLLETTDGGRTWTTVSGPSTETLTVTGGNVYRLAYTKSGCPGPCYPVLQRSPVTGLRWQTVLPHVTQPLRNNTATIVGSGTSVLVAEFGDIAGGVSATATIYRSLDAGRTWQLRNDPCARYRPKKGGERALVAVGSSAGGVVAGLCLDQSNPEKGGFTVVSTDDGGSWRRGNDLPGGGWEQIAAPSSHVLIVATSATTSGGVFRARLVRSTDSGLHWNSAVSETQTLHGPSPAWLGFQTPTTGEWISGRHTLWTTTTGGATWVERRIG
jgi:photosystem II stability/assembly factor-like uncharacterized protein